MSPLRERVRIPSDDCLAGDGIHQATIRLFQARDQVLLRRKRDTNHASIFWALELPNAAAAAQVPDLGSAQTTG